MTYQDEEGVPLPHEPSFERRILGAAIEDPASFETVMRSLTAKDFYAPDHQDLFRVLSARFESGHAVEQDLLISDIRALSDSRIEDPFRLVSTLVVEAARPAALKEYIKKVKACSNARQVNGLARSLASESLVTQSDPEYVTDLITEYEERMRILSSEASEHPWLTMEEIRGHTEEATTETILPTGFIDLDRILQGGLRTKQLVVVAGRPAMGKSTISLDVARHLSIDRGVPGLFISLEMSDTELFYRTVSAEASVTLNAIRNREVSEEEGEAIAGVSGKIDASPLYVLDSSEVSLSKLRSTIAAAVRFLGIKYVVLDYLQLANNPSLRGQQNREQEIASISRALKADAKRHDICVIAVAQLNRGPESRTDKTPQMSDLRESGQLEQDSDIVMLVWRPDYYDSTTERVGEADLNVAKHRNGETGVASLAFQGHYSRFTSLSRDDVRPGA